MTNYSPSGNGLLMPTLQPVFSPSQELSLISAGTDFWSETILNITPILCYLCPHQHQCSPLAGWQCRISCGLRQAEVYEEM